MTLRACYSFFMHLKRRWLLPVLVVLALPLHAREIHWNALEVSATLAKDGSLHVTERHDMVFDGDWNGGERRFDLRRGQTVEVRSVARMHDGVRELLEEGSLDEVGRWQQSGDVLRWRSRRPEDPPFAGTRLVYEIEYVLTGVVQETSGRYSIDHELVPLDRAGSIDSFGLTFRIEAPWSTDVAMPVQRSATNLAPGDGHQLELSLERTDATSPAVVRRTMGAFPRLAGIVVMLIAVVLLFMAWLRYERVRGRFDRLPEVDADTVAAEISGWVPEVLGAAWDEGVGAAEVAAVLARLQSTGVLRSTVDDSGGAPELQMELLVSRDTLEGYDRALIDGLFFDGDRTSTTAMKEHYKGSGYNPSSVITRGVMDQLAKHVEWSTNSRSPGCLLSGLAWPFVVLFSAVWSLVTPAPADVIAPAVAFSLFFLVVGGVIAYITSRRPTLGRGSIIAWNVVPAIGIVASAASIISAEVFTDWWGIVPIVLLVVATYAACTFAARTSMSESRLRLRRRLLAMRNWIEAELRKDEPALRDEWMPHILALGLGDDVDRWFGASSSRVTPIVPVMGRSTGTGSSGGGSFSGPGGAWSGGGTSFGGGGATGAWVAAASGLAAGVASPSSSSGGGGSGGSSSGGGGAGGW